MSNELKSLDAVEMEIKARYNGKYTSTPEYQASERATRKAIVNIFKYVANLPFCLCPVRIPVHVSSTLQFHVYRADIHPQHINYILRLFPTEIHLLNFMVAGYCQLPENKCYTLMDICKLHSHVPIMHCDHKHIKSNYCIFCAKIRCRTVSSCTL